MNNTVIIQILVGFLLTLTLTMGGWSLKQHFDTNAKLAEMSVMLVDIKENTEWQAKQERIDKMHWKYLSWSKQQINKLYSELDMELPDEPDLD